MAKKDCDASQPMPNSAGQDAPDAEPVVQDGLAVVLGSQLRLLRILGRAVAAELRADLRRSGEATRSAPTLDPAQPE